MSPPLFIALPGNEEMASRLALSCGGELGGLELSDFPDGESHLRFMVDLSGRSLVLVCSLFRPNAKILPLLFAADAARDLGAGRVGLVAPYLCYMRQDRRFQSGEAVTSEAFAKLVSRGFDWLATVDPHLHRRKSLAEIYSIPSCALHAGPALAAWIQANTVRPFLIGPDEESRQWVEGVARACGAPFVVLAKRRSGDREVHISMPDSVLPAGVTPIFLDDIVSSGATMREAIRLVPPSPRPVALAIHTVLTEGAAENIASAGARLVSCNTVPSNYALIDVTSLIAGAIADFL